MEITKICAMIGFGISALFLGGNGIAYLCSKRIQSYHQAAFQLKWDNMSHSQQVISLCFMKSAATGMLSTFIAAAFLLCFPFQQEELWATFALTALLSCENVGLLIRVYQVKYKSDGNPPIIFSIVSCVLTFISFILAMI